MLDISLYELLGCTFYDILLIHVFYLNHISCVFPPSPLLKSSAKPADWKYQNGLSTSWLSLECIVHINIHIPLSTTSVSYTLEKNTKVSGQNEFSVVITEQIIRFYSGCLCHSFCNSQKLHANYNDIIMGD